MACRKSDDFLTGDFRFGHISEHQFKNIIFSGPWIHKITSHTCRQKEVVYKRIINSLNPVSATKTGGSDCDSATKILTRRRKVKRECRVCRDKSTTRREVLWEDFLEINERINDDDDGDQLHQNQRRLSSIISEIQLGRRAVNEDIDNGQLQWSQLR